MQLSLECYHCGEKVLSSKWREDGSNFCCQGCKAVYQLIKNKGLASYYTMSEKPGINPADTVSYFDFLEEERLQQVLLQYKDENLGIMHFDIPAIHCSACIWLLENIHRIDNGIYSSEVNFTDKRLTVKYNPSLTGLRNISETLSKLGYTPVFNLDNKDKEQSAEEKYMKHLLLRLGVAGFCFGNIMLLAFPEYFDTSGQLERFLKDWFGYISIGLSLPVVLYCAQPYWQSAWKSIRNKYINLDVPIVLGIMALFGYSIYEITSNTGMGYLDSLGALLFLMLTGKYFQQRTYRALSFDRDYKSFFPIAVQKLTDNGLEKSIMIDELEVNDMLMLRHGEVIPVDGILENGPVKLDYSFITGESQLNEISKGDFIYAGGRLAGSKAKVKVTHKLSDSDLLNLWNNNPNSLKKIDTDIKKITTKVSRYFTPVLLAIAFSSLGAWIIAGDVKMGIKAFSTCLIIACPCALALTIPFTYGSVMRKFAANNFYLKNTDVLEELQQVTDIVFDKTGTLACSKEGETRYIGTSLTEEEKHIIQAAASNSIHSSSKNISNFLPSRQIIPDYFEEQIGEGIIATVKDKKVRLGKLSFIRNNPANSINEVDKKSTTHVSIDGDLKGFFSFNNKYREGISGMVSQLRKNYRLHVLSGDTEEEKQRLTHVFGTSERMFFRQSPLSKQKYIEELQERKKKVLMIGDGLNDAGALQASNFSISVTDDTSFFTPAADGIIKGNMLNKLPNILTLAKKAKKIAVFCFIISFTYNVIGLSYAVQGMMSPVLAAIIMPLSSITVVSFTTAAIYLTAKKIFL